MHRVLKAVFLNAKKEILRGLPKTSLSKNSKGQTTKFFDRHIEDRILSILSKKIKTNFVVITEEKSKPVIIRNNPSNEFGYIIIDPVDGSDNYVNGVPFVCLGIAVFDSGLNPLYSFAGNYYTGEYLYADTKKLLHNGRRFAGPAKQRRKSALFTFSKLKPARLKRAHSLNRYFDTIRSLGATIGEIMMVVTGAASAFIDVRGRLTMENFAPFFLICRHAKCVMCGLDNRAIKLKSLSLSAGYEIIVTPDSGTKNKILKAFTGASK